MKYTFAPVVLFLVAFCTTAAHAQFDRVKVGSGSISGKIIEISPTKIVVDQNSSNKEIPVNTVSSVSFAREPSELSNARNRVLNGGFEDAKDFLSKVDLSAIDRAEIKADVQYYLAYAAGKLSLGGQGSVQAATDQMIKFVQDNRNSFHFYEACEILGDLAVRAKNYPSAMQYYGLLNKAPWPDFKMRAAVMGGRVRQAQGDHAGAIQLFDSVLAGDKNEETESQILAATLGKAISQAETGQVEPAIAMVNKVIQDANPEEAELHARAYNALGTCHVKAGNHKDALLAFLHVDVLYNAFPEAHAEALSHLAKLWETVGKGDRAREASNMLADRYPGSPWVQN